MKVSLKAIFDHTSHLDVYLPRYVFVDIHKDYEQGSVNSKGIVVECLFNLWMRRFYKANSAWTQDEYSCVDFIVPGCLIDVKSTTLDRYTHHDIPRAKEMAMKVRRDFAFVLVTPDHWDLRQGLVRLKVHELLTCHPNQTMSRVRYEGATKRFSAW